MGDVRGVKGTLMNVFVLSRKCVKELKGRTVQILEDHCETGLFTMCSTLYATNERSCIALKAEP